MSDVHDDEITDDEPEPEAKGPKDLRAAAARSEKHRLEAESLRRENAFLRAGVDTETRGGKLLLKAYDGDLADIAALKAEAEALGALTKTETAVTPVTAEVAISPAEQEALSKRGAVASGAPPSSLVAEGKDPYLEASQTYESSVGRGASKQDAMALAFHHVADKFLQGDARTQVKAPQ